MGNIVGKQFKVVASKNLKDSLADSVKSGNQAKFYLAQNNNPNEQKALDSVTEVTDNDRNVLIINGNTIQGVSKNDISKLDAISDATKIFRYQGSLATKSALLAKIPPFVKVGDVYNVESEVMLDGFCYPPHTNFVYIGGHGNTELNWDSLGGIMQIGTHAFQIKESESVLVWKTDNDAPLSELRLTLATDSCLHINDDTSLGLAISSSLGISANGSLYVRLSSSASVNKIFLVDSEYGISLDYTELVRSLMSDYPLKVYIGSLINQALRAQ